MLGECIAATHTLRNITLRGTKFSSVTSYTESSGLLFGRARDGANVIIETVKQQMDGDGIVLRVYECFGRRVSGVRVRLGYAPEQAEEANLLEQPIGEAQLSGRELVFDMKPYEIKTFLLR